GPFFFAAVEKFERALTDMQTPPRVLIIRLKWVPFIDITGLQALEEVISNLQERGIKVWLTGANERVLRKIEKAGILEQVGREANFKEFSSALEACQKECLLIYDDSTDSLSAISSSKSVAPI